MKIPNPAAAFFLTLQLFIAPGGTAAEEAPEPQARGSYAKGSLVNPLNLPLEGPGYVRLFRSRSRGFGTSALVLLIEGLATEMAEIHPEGERIQVGDLSAIGGGRISGHASHQNGLDADLSYFRVNRLEQSVDQEEEFIEEFVQAGVPTLNFDLDRNWTYLSRAAGTGKVQRMFVDAAIKRAFCESRIPAGGESEAEAATIETLRRLRPYPHHADHVHLRLFCPSASPECVAQAEVPPGSGCSELALWIEDPSLDEALRREHDGI